MSTPQTLTLTPITRGTKVVVPAGTPLWSSHPSAPNGPSSHRQIISVVSTFTAYDYPWSHWTERIPGYISWVTNGGYWREAEVTPELIAANPDLDFTGLV